MEQVDKLIDSKFSKKITFWSVDKHQKHGTCVIKCLHAALHDALPEEEYRKYKLWMTEREIKKLDGIVTRVKSDLENDKSDPNFFRRRVVCLAKKKRLETHIKTMKIEAFNVLKKREVKAKFHVRRFIPS